MATKKKDSPLWLSRTFWIGLGQIIAGIGPLLSGMVEVGIAEMLTGFGLITGRVAVKKNGVKAAMIVPFLMLLLLAGCAALRSFLGLDPGGADDAAAIQQTGEGLVNFSGILPPLAGQIVWGLGQAVSVAGGIVAHVKKKRV
jgi:hypothetical protein